MPRLFVLSAVLRLVFEPETSFTPETPPQRRSDTQLTHGCSRLSWNELLRLAEVHTEGARKCLERFVVDGFKGEEGLLAKILLEEWEKDPNQEGALQVPRPLHEDSNCMRVPEIAAEIEAIRPRFVNFEVWVNRQGQARWARVVSRLPSKPVPLYEKCELEFALRQRYRPAWKGRRFVAQKLSFFAHWR